MGGFRSRIAVVSFYGIDSVICEVPKTVVIGSWAIPGRVGTFIGGFVWCSLTPSKMESNGGQCVVARVSSIFSWLGENRGSLWILWAC